MSANNPPPVPVEGRLVVSYLKNLVSWIKKNRPIAGPGLLQKQTEGGIVFSLSSGDAGPFAMTAGTGSTLQIAGGGIWNWDATNARPVLDNMASGTATLATGTSNVYVECTTTPTSISTYYVAWVNSGYSFVADTSEKSNTVDFDDAVGGAGLSYVKIGEAVVSGGEITSITPIINETIDHKWPWTLDLGTFSCS